MLVRVVTTPGGVEASLSGSLGPINMSGSAWFQSDGQFSVTLSGGLYFGISGFSISGKVSGTVSLTKSGTNYVYRPSDTYTLTVEISGRVNLTIIGISIGASVTLGGRGRLQSEWNGALTICRRVRGFVFL